MQVLAGIVLTLLGAATATPVDVRVTLSPPEIPFYRQATFTIQADAPADVEVKLPDMKDKFGGVQIYGERKDSTVTLKDGRKRTTATYVLDAAKEDEYFIAPVEVTWGNGERVTVPSPALRVRPATDEEKKTLAVLSDITLPAPQTPILRPWMGWTVIAALSAVAVAMLSMLIFLFWSRRPSAQAPRFAWEVARHRLQSLRAREVIDPNLFYIELSDILREYIEERFRLHAPERTTPEFLSEATGTGLFSQEHQELLAGVLRGADRVKFAKHEPSEIEMERHFNEVWRFVEETVPRIAAPTEEAAA